jgi:hypothetical protein
MGGGLGSLPNAVLFPPLPAPKSRKGSAEGECGVSEKLRPERDNLTSGRRRFSVSKLGLPEIIAGDLAQELAQAQLDFQDELRERQIRLTKETSNAQEYREELACFEEMFWEGHIGRCMGAIFDAFMKTAWSTAEVKDAAEAAIGEFLEDYGTAVPTRKKLEDLLREPPYHWHYRKFLEDLAERVEESKIRPPEREAKAENGTNVVTSRLAVQDSLPARRGRPPARGGKRNHDIAKVALGIEDWKHKPKVVAESLDASPLKPAPPRGRTTWLDYFQSVEDKHFKKAINDAIAWSRKSPRA